MSPQRFANLSCVVVALGVVGCSSIDDVSPVVDRASEVVVCHVPPGDPAAAHTISVGGGAVAVHLGHGDTLGPCQTACEAACEEVGAGVEEVCLNASLPETLDCELAGDLVEAGCAGACPEPTPETCHDFCLGVAQAAHDACLSRDLGGDPMICQVGSDVTYNECVAAFECPPPPPSCWDECFFAYDEAIQACFEQGGDPMCFEPVEVELQACHAGCCADECTMDCQPSCMGDPACEAQCADDCWVTCTTPPPPSCWDECFFAFDAAIQMCAPEDSACHEQAQLDLMACESGCCSQQCALDCEQLCGGDPMCQDQCESDCSMMCLPQPPPPPDPCFDACSLAFDEAIQACDMLGGDPECFHQAEMEHMDCVSQCGP